MENNTFCHKRAIGTSQLDRKQILRGVYNDLDIFFSYEQSKDTGISLIHFQPCPHTFEIRLIDGTFDRRSSKDLTNNIIER